MQLPSLASKELSRLKEILPVPSHGSGLGLTGHLSGGGMVEDKRTVDRRKAKRRTQERRDVERRFVFFDRLFKFLFASIVILIAVWVYIFTE